MWRIIQFIARYICLAARSNDHASLFTQLSISVVGRCADYQVDEKDPAPDPRPGIGLFVFNKAAPGGQLEYRVRTCNFKGDPVVSTGQLFKNRQVHCLPRLDHPMGGSHRVAFH